MRKENRTREMPGANAGVVEHLRALPYFDPFDAQELEDIARLCSFRDIAAGETIISQGAPSDGRVYIMLAGKVAVSVNDRFILGLSRRGDIVGEMGLVGEENRSATVRTEISSRFLVLSSASELMAGPEHSLRLRYYFASMFNSILADKLRITSERAKLYEDAILSSRQAEAHSADLEARISHNVRQIRLYSHLVESAHDVILICSLDGLVEHANPAFARVFGIAADQVIGKPLGQLLGLDTGGPRGWTALSDAARKEGWRGEVDVNEFGRRDPVPAECTLSMVRTDRQAPLAFAVLLRDLRERKAYEARILRQQRELEQANTELKAADQLKDRFLTRVSHELRTPLTSVLGSLEMLNTPGMIAPDQQSSFLDLMFREAKILAGRVDKLLAIAKIESGQMAFSFEPADPLPLIDQAIAQVRPMAAQKGIPLRFDSNGTLRKVNVDAEQFPVALVEILDNAVKYTDRGEITVRVSQNGEETLFEVEDRGGGIHVALRDQLFETLSQVRHGSDSSHGLGLGLPLSRLIVTAHSGTLGVEGAPGGGSIFWIRLPLTTALSA